MQFPVLSLSGQFTEGLALDLDAAARGLTLAPANEVATALSPAAHGFLAFLSRHVAAHADIARWSTIAHK